MKANVEDDVVMKSFAFGDISDARNRASVALVAV
jgi:hypothetical protein